jgi:hypothetical protein
MTDRVSVRSRRWLVVLLAALVAVVMAVNAGLMIAPAAHASGGQNRVRAQDLAGGTQLQDSGPVIDYDYDPAATSTTSPANVVEGAARAIRQSRGAPETTVVAMRFVVAAEGTAAVARELAPIAGGAPILGEGGVQVTSRTLLRDTGQGFRIDVENPAPGVRPGQLHLQDVGGGKYLYDFETNQFEGLPPGLARQVAGNSDVASAIAKARDYLNVPQP